MRNTKVTVKKKKWELPYVSRLKTAGGNSDWGGGRQELGFKAKPLFNISFLMLKTVAFDKRLVGKRRKWEDEEMMSRLRLSFVLIFGHFSIVIPIRLQAYEWHTDGQ